jgi:hypothetical protein
VAASALLNNGYADEWVGRWVAAGSVTRRHGSLPPTPSLAFPRRRQARAFAFRRASGSDADLMQKLSIHTVKK